MGCLVRQSERGRDSKHLPMQKRKDSVLANGVLEKLWLCKHKFSEFGFIGNTQFAVYIGNFSRYIPL